jgi:phosphatidylglycerophosphate synthase
MLVRPLVDSAVTPNQLTGLSLFTGLAAGGLYALGGAAVHWGAALFMIYAFIDHADGELARMTGKTSKFGHYFDLLADGFGKVVLFIGMGVGLQGGILGGWASFMGIAAGVSVGLTFALRAELERRLGKDVTAQPAWAGFEIEDVLYLIGPITWLGGLVPFLIAAGIGAPVFLIWQIWGASREERERAANETGFSEMFWDQRLAHLIVHPFAESFLTPNQLTALGFICGLTAGGFYALGGWAVHIGAVLFLLALLADHADGELARMNGETSVSGHYFGRAAAGITYTALFAGMGTGLQESALGSWAVTMGIVVAAAVAITYLVVIAFEFMRGPRTLIQPAWYGFRIEDVMYLAALATWLGGLVFFFVAAGAAAPVFLVWRVRDIYRTGRDG